MDFLIQKMLSILHVPSTDWLSAGWALVGKRDISGCLFVELTLQSSEEAGLKKN